MPELSDFSYRSESRAPAIDDRFPIALMDFECALRNHIEAGIARNRHCGFVHGDLCGLPGATLRARLMCDPP